MDSTLRYAPLDVPVTLPDVSVVIVSYNVRVLLEQALLSVARASDGLRVEVFVVDNASTDGSAAMVREKFPDVHLIANTENVGFSRANNQAIRQAQGRHVLLLNPDTVLQEDTLRVLADFLAGTPQAGAVGCRILNPDGTFAPESRRAFPTPEVAFYRIAGLSRLFPQHPRFGRYNLTFLPRDEVVEVDALSGSCMMVRRTALFFSHADAASLRQRGHDPVLCVPPLTDAMLAQASGAGLLDEGFFMYGEDLDWCYRIQRAGWKIYYTPETQLLHYKGESTNKDDVRYVNLFYGAMLRFMEKHFGAQHSRAFVKFMAAGVHLRAALSVVKRAAKQAVRPVRPGDGKPRPQRVLLLGSKAQARRLAPVLAAQPEPMILAGETTPMAPDALRARIREKEITVLVFAAADLSYQTMLDTMRALSDLRLSFRIFPPDHPFLIGKDTLDGDTPSVAA